MVATRPVRRCLQACLPALFVFAMAAPALARQAPPAPLQERMSYAQFKRLGLDKLSPAQLKALNAWLATHGERGPSMDSATARPGGDTAPAASGNRDIHTHIVGTFRGWDTGTVFTLANGQRWQVADDSSLMIHSMKKPAVTLRKSFFGSWLLEVDGVDQSVHVTRKH